MAVQDTPRGSPPMYFPSGFVLADARACAALVDIAYAQYSQWVRAGSPPASNFNWDKPNNGYSYSAPLFSTFNYYDIWGYKYVATEPFGFAAVDANGNAYLALRGTMTSADGYADLTIDQTAYDIVANYGFVQEGYYYIYQGFNSTITQAIAGLAGAKPFQSFFFTAHSLGGALSSLAVPDVLAKTSVQPAKIPVMHYNFASPRVGDPQFADRMNKNGVTTFRVVNTEDAVPDAPLAISGLSAFYKHIGTPVDFTAQYDSIVSNHSLDIAYNYALRNPSNPEGPLPPAALELARRTDRHAVIDARLIRLTRSPQLR
jgi:triacylglycerol lipase